MSVVSLPSPEYIFYHPAPQIICLSSSSTDYLFYHPSPHIICFIILLHKLSVLSSSSTEYLLYHPAPNTICFIILLHHVSVLSFSSIECLFYHPPPQCICFVILPQRVVGLSASSTNCPPGGACEGDHHLEWPAPPDHSCRPETEGPEDPEAALLPRGPLATATLIHHPLTVACRGAGGGWSSSWHSWSISSR